MQVNSVICKCDHVECLLAGEPKIDLEYRGCHISVGKTTVTLFITREHIKEIFFSINLATDLSCALSEYFRKEVQVFPRISNVQGSKTLNIERCGKSLRDFIREIDEISGLQEVRVCQEGNLFLPILLAGVFQNPVWEENNFIAIQTKSNDGKLTCKFQINKEKSKYLASFIVTNFDKKAQQFNKFLQNV